MQETNDVKFVQEFEKAVESDHWMAVVWRVEGDELHCYRVTNKFPCHRFQEAGHLLQNDLNRELDKYTQIDTSPLPEVDPRTQMINNLVKSQAYSKND